MRRTMVIAGFSLCSLVLGLVVGYTAGRRAPDKPVVYKQGARINTDPHVFPVTNVLDGDTVEVWRDGAFEVVRLLNIDTPERGEAGYEEATSALRNWPVRLVWESEDGPTRGKYGRLLAHLFLGQVGKTCVNVEMVRLGWSPYWTKYGAARFPERFKEAETEARENRRGIWATSAAMQSDADASENEKEKR